MINVGDSGYPLEPWLLTPFGTPATAIEQKYNSLHSRTRNVVERCFGLMKSRFRCLDRSGGTLLYSPEKTCKIVAAVSVLHNICIDRGIPTTVDAGVQARSAALQPPTIPQNNLSQTGTAVELRRRIAEQLLSLL